MAAVKVSPKFQVVIPREVRESMGLYAGQEVDVIAYDGQIRIIPIRPMKEMRGFVRGIDTTIEREPDREF
jgi:AbrB family looped-hinge helix DNA binding protein